MDIRTYDLLTMMLLISTTFFTTINAAFGVTYLIGKGYDAGIPQYISTNTTVICISILVAALNAINICCMLGVCCRKNEFIHKLITVCKLLLERQGVKDPRINREELAGKLFEEKTLMKLPLEAFAPVEGSDFNNILAQYVDVDLSPDAPQIDEESGRYVVMPVEGN